jgi:FlaA1/EpsC-like NDP-sugar epimerase
MAIYGRLGSSERDYRRSREHGLILRCGSLDLRLQRVSAVDFYHRFCSSDFLYGGSRLAAPLLRNTKNQSRKEGFGLQAGDAGEMIVRGIKNNSVHYNYEPIGFIDDNPNKIGRRLHGIPMMSARDDIPEILKSDRLDEVLLAIPSASRALVRQVLTV